MANFEYGTLTGSIIRGANFVIVNEPGYVNEWPIRAGVKFLRPSVVEQEDL